MVIRDVGEVGVVHLVKGGEAQCKDCGCYLRSERRTLGSLLPLVWTRTTLCKNLMADNLTPLGTLCLLSSTPSVAQRKITSLSRLRVPQSSVLVLLLHRCRKING